DNDAATPYRFIVSEAFVHKHLPNTDPLGKSISVLMDSNNPYGEIIGVADDVKEGSLTKAPEPTDYYVYGHLPFTTMSFVVRADRDPLGLVNAVRGIVRDLDPALPVANVQTMETVLGETWSRERFSAILLGGFSISALLLAAI